MTNESEPASSIQLLKKRHNRRKPHLAWEQAELASRGLYAHDLQTIAKKFPKLTPMELRVCVLVKEMLPSWRIAEVLGISEKTVEKHHLSARIKVGSSGHTSLREALL